MDGWMDEWMDGWMVANMSLLVNSYIVADTHLHN